MQERTLGLRAGLASRSLQFSEAILRWQGCSPLQAGWFAVQREETCFGEMTICLAKQAEFTGQGKKKI